MPRLFDRGTLKTFLSDFISEEIKRRRKSGYTFGSRSAVKRTRSPQTPGPQYKPEEPGSFQPQRGFSFGHRPRFERRISDVPGPGEYDAGEKFIFKGTPAYTFGVKNHVRGRNAFFQNLTPGPGEHYNFDDITKKTSPSYSFGTLSRPRIFAPDYDQPGPGEFVLNIKIFQHFNKFSSHTDTSQTGQRTAAPRKDFHSECG